MSKMTQHKKGAEDFLVKAQDGDRATLRATNARPGIPPVDSKLSSARGSLIFETSSKLIAVRPKLLNRRWMRSLYSGAQQGHAIRFHHLSDVV